MVVCCQEKLETRSNPYNDESGGQIKQITGATTVRSAPILAQQSDSARQTAQRLEGAPRDVCVYLKDIFSA